MGAVLGAAALAVCLVPGGSPASAGKGGKGHKWRLAPATVEGVRVLITDDDGVQPGPGSQGLYELRKALCAAGADVAVVGPWADRSGASASITYGSSSTRFTLTKPEIEAAYHDD